MSDDLCKHGWSRRFCEQCSQARIIASLKGPGDKGMLANPPDDLVERVGRALMRAEPWSSFWGKDDAEKLARAAIALVLEEAAKCADAAVSHQWQGRKIAAAIRALVQK